MSLKEEVYLEKTASDDPGCRPMDVYDATLPAWRAAVRRKLVASIRVESVLVAKMQASLVFPGLLFYFFAAFGRLSGIPGRVGRSCDDSHVGVVLSCHDRLGGSMCIGAAMFGLVVRPPF